MKELPVKKDMLTEELSSEKSYSSVNKYRLKMKTEELMSLKEKYDQLVLQHSLC